MCAHLSERLLAAKTLDELRQLCERRLSPPVTQGEKLVFGAGAPRADIVIIGEAPGAQEARTGQPFVGSAGKLLNRSLHEIGLEREKIYIGNVLKTRPPGNRKPRRNEIKNELPFLLRQIELIQPDLLVLLGATALQALTGPTAKITQLRGSWIEAAGRPALVTYHPAAALRDEARKAALRQDFAALRKRLESP